MKDILSKLRSFDQMCIFFNCRMSIVFSCRMNKSKLGKTKRQHQQRSAKKHFNHKCFKTPKTRTFPRCPKTITAMWVNHFMPPIAVIVQCCKKVATRYEPSHPDMSGSSSQAQSSSCSRSCDLSQTLPESCHSNGLHLLHPLA